MTQMRDGQSMRNEELAVRPEPSDDARRALAAAIEQSRRVEPVSAWWRAGIEESVGRDEG